MKKPKNPRDLVRNPVTRSLLLRDWESIGLSARIHAMIGGDSDALVHGAGTVFYVILGAAAASGASDEDPDIRILRGAVNAMAEQQGEADIPEARRAAILSGLRACERIAPLLPRRALADVVVDLTVKLLDGHVMASDFQERIALMKP